ncbi:hypothetical protein ACVIGB_005265 [Bradyrhizobium sp. USDA 4341]
MGKIERDSFGVARRSKKKLLREIAFECFRGSVSES